MISDDNILQTCFAYFRKLGIHVSRNQFSDALKSHPEYPNVIAVAYTLDLFDIPYNAYTSSFEEVSSEHKLYMAVFMHENGEQQCSLVERKNKNEFYIDSKKTSVENVMRLWGNIILIIETPSNSMKGRFYKKRILKIAFIALLVFFSIVILGTQPYHLLFCILSLVGIVLTLGAFRNLLVIENPLLEGVCLNRKKTDCTEVIQSDKWNVLQRINPADFSLTFFTGQLISLLVLLPSGYEMDFFSYQKIFLYFSIPIIVLSLYYQKFVVKKWCSICLGIIIIIVLEHILIHQVKFSFSINYRSLFLFLTSYVSVFIVWRTVKNYLERLNGFREETLKHRRFLNSYEVFKHLLAKNGKYAFDFNFRSKKNTGPTMEITLITDLFCDHCHLVHQKLKRLRDNGGNFDLKVVFNIDIDDEYNKDKILYRNMAYLQQYDHDLFLQGIHDWYNARNVEKWLSSYGQVLENNIKLENTLNVQKDWCAQNGFNYTPAILVNGYLLPGIYTVGDLAYMMEDFLEDLEYYE